MILSSFPVILGENNLNEKNKAADMDMDIDESNINIHNSYNLWPMEETSEMFDGPQIQVNFISANYKSRGSYFCRSRIN